MPPMPALIPISALRGGGSKTPDNNNGPVSGGHAPDCGPCDRVQHRHLDDGVEESSPGGEGEEGNETPQRLTRRPLETTTTRAIDAADGSRDLGAGEQAPCVPPPAQPVRMQRHRKSERRRREHRSSFRRRSSSSSTITTTTRESTTTREVSEASDIESASASASTHEGTACERKSQQPPRVNPIFVWVRQEDTRIVDVRCEDYDKRNRILLTKTAHGWRAIPRTETLAGSLEEKPVSTVQPPSDRHRHEKSKGGPGRPPKSSKKSRRRRDSDKTITSESTSTEAPEVEIEIEPEVSVTCAPDSPWNRANQDIESHLPSHTITIPKRHRPNVTEEVEVSVKEVNECPVSEVLQDSDEVDSDSVNSELAQARVEISSVSPLDKLLAAAEIAFNNQVNEQNPDLDCAVSDPTADSVECANDPSDSHELAMTDNVVSVETDDCDYNEEDDDDENNFSHVLDKLERSLQSPIISEEEEDINRELEQPSAEQDLAEIDEQELEIQEIPDEDIDELSTIEEGKGEEEELVEEQEQEQEQPVEQEEQEEEEEMEPNEQEYESTVENEKLENTNEQESVCDQPTDLTIKLLAELTEDDMTPTDLSTHSKEKESSQSKQSEQPTLDDMLPTDLSIRKHSITGLIIEPIVRPPSQNSETIQSPQPSGIPAVPPSPDILQQSKQVTTKSIFLESLLATSPKLALNPELTITRNQKEPLDLGKGRKSASPTVTCSEEVKNPEEPTPKKLKMEDITLKNLLHADCKKPEITIKPIPNENKKPVIKDQSSRLLELLTAETIPDAMTQLKQLLADPHVNIPDPMLVPKDRLSHILAAPAKEIPRLLIARPELRLPEALSHPTLMNDPDILVITMDQLHTILEKHLQPISLDESLKNKITSLKDTKVSPVEKTDKHQNQKMAKSQKNTSPQVNQQMIANDYHRYIQNLQHQHQLMLQEAQIKHHQSQMMRKPGLANDIDAATAASFNQMMWLPYLNQLEQAAQITGNNQEFLKMLNTVFPNGGYPGPPEHVPPLMGGGRFGLQNAMPMHPIDYNLEMAMWQEAMLRQKMPNSSQENSIALAKQAAVYRENIEKINQQMNASNKPKMNSGASNGSHLLNSHHNGGSLMNNHNLNGHRSNLYNNLVQKQQSQRNQQGLSSARTNPIQHMSDQQLLGMKNPFLRSTSLNMKSNFHMPHYNNSVPQSPNQKYSNDKLLKESLFGDKMNLSSLCQAYSAKNNPFYSTKESKLDQKIHRSFSRSHSLPEKELSPPRSSGEPHKPIDLSGTTSSKLKVRTNLLSGGFASSRLEEIAEVGSTTEDAGHLHETPTHHVWHPLFGK